MKKIIFVLFVVCIFSATAQSADLMLPFPGGQTWSCDQGNNDTPTHSGDLAYAWDFNMGRTSDLGLPVLAPASGTVIYAKNSNSNWGNTVIIDYGDGTFGKLAHLQLINVSKGQLVNQGKQIGTCGGTPCWSPHIHYQTQKEKYINSESIQSAFIDAEEPDRIPKLHGHYTSLNTYNPYNNFKVGKFNSGWKIEPWGTSFGGIFIPYSRPFVITYFHNGGFNSLGHPANPVHQATVYDLPGYNQYAGISLPYIQDIQNTSGGDPWLTFVLNPYVLNIRMNYLGVVFPIHGQIRNYWRANYSNYGPPVSNEYAETINGDQYSIQWFEKSENNFVKITYNNHTGIINDSASSSATYGDKLNQSLEENLGCSGSVCGVGGENGDTTPEPEPPPNPNFTFNKSKICGDIGENWSCLDERYAFYNNDNRVFSWVEILNLYEAINLKWVWYDPNNNIISQIEDNTDQPYEEGGYFGWWHHNSWVGLSDTSERGTYTVKFYINNILTNTLYFELRETGGEIVPPILRIE